MTDRATLRGLLEAAWNDGWSQRGALSNVPLGVRIEQKKIRLHRFLEPGTGDVADERLFDAAPELLAALKAIDAHWRAGNFSREPSLWDPMTAAIAKAEGR